MKRMIQKTWMACIALMCVCFASCNDDAIVETSQPNETGQPFRLTATQGTPSRLELGQDGMTVTWEPGDQLVLVKKDRTIVPIYMNAELTAPSTSATFVSETGVPAGEYWVIYNYNDDLAYTHHGFSSIDNINNENKLVLWGELTVVQGNTSASISLQHLYAKVRVELQNLPSDETQHLYQVGMYASKNGFPIYNQLNQSGIVDVDHIYDGNRIVYKASNRRYHNIRFGAYHIPEEYNGETGGYESDLSQKTEIEKNSALILPADVSDGIVYFYILKGNECYEISKSNIKFKPGESYKVVLDMATATKTTLTGIEFTIPGSYTHYFYQLATPEDCRHAAYLGSKEHNYMLMNDIDFQNNTFLPLSTRYFFGNGKIMKNISIDWSDEDYVGLIRHELDIVPDDGFSPYYSMPFDPTRYSCTISDLTLENVQFKGANYVGALGATNVGAENCKIKGTSSIIGSGDYIGGFVGCNYLDDGSQFSISNSSIDGTCAVEGKNYVGGILGKCDNYYDRQITLPSLRLLNSCSSAATVQATGDYVGGIFGAVEDSWIQFSSEDYTLSLYGCVNTGNVTGHNYVGGIGGQFGLYCSSSVKDKVVIMQSANEGNLTGVNYIGGIVGSHAASINLCYSIGDYSASGTDLGGIVGSIGSMSSSLTNCYSIANLTIGAGGYAGGLLGHKLGWMGMCKIENCYFAGTNTANCGIIGYSGGYVDITNCLTTLSDFGDVSSKQADWDVNGDGFVDANDVIPTNVTNSFTDITSILQNKSVINNDNAYSDVIWQNYPYDCVKFAAGLSGSVVAPGFGTEIIY